MNNGDKTIKIGRTLNGAKLGCINALHHERGLNMESGIKFNCLNTPRSLGIKAIENGGVVGDKLAMDGMLYILEIDGAGGFAQYKFKKAF